MEGIDALEWLTHPAIGGKSPGTWLAFLAILLSLLAFDLMVLGRRWHDRPPTARESLALAGFFIASAIAYGAWVWLRFGHESGLHFFTGYLVEEALSLDNIFVISVIFASLGIPGKYQHGVLFWGILGAVVMRGLMIALGTALVSRIASVLYIFGAFLIYTGIRMLRGGDDAHDPADNRLLRFLKGHFHVTDRLHGDHFFVRLPVEDEPGRGAAQGKARRVLHMTPLFVALVLVEGADLVFAVDSVPAIFAITTDPYVVYTSNMFAILGLRALYFSLAALVRRFRYLKTALSVLLVFIGGKIFYNHFFEPITPVVSLLGTLGILAAGVLVSLVRTGGEAPAD
ncbi:MAG TPA: TerC family protein [Bacillota bacterium]